MIVKNKLINCYILMQIKIYKMVKKVSPFLGEIIEENIKKKAKNNFLDILEKSK